ncbi:hypothetical protein Hypma_002198 [Hypsizygus marmoreus]|uniref:Uncharacterized protein n=1 Tax=Hypsizygus marmoreus TaxID=39966 RepID=A0A369K3J2_HYPMA|nr:hypothetical protein Hypma_002198 [Hypsizygus marmoreus]
MAYVNPLHAPVSSSHRSGYSSIGGAVHNAPEPSKFLSPFRRHLPQATYTPISKWRTSTGRTNTLHNTVTFDFLGYNKQGVPMRELSTRGSHALAAMIHGANDLVLAHTRLTRITLVIIWPGYEHVEWSRTVEIHPDGPITRSALGAAVAMNFARFMEKSRNERAMSPEWQIGISGIRFEHVILLSLRNVFEDVWQADVAVDLR